MVLINSQLSDRLRVLAARWPECAARGRLGDHRHLSSCRSQGAYLERRAQCSRTELRPGLASGTAADFIPFPGGTSLCIEEHKKLAQGHKRSNTATYVNQM